MSQVVTKLGGNPGPHGPEEFQVAFTADAYTNGSGINVSVSTLTSRDWAQVSMVSAQCSTGHSVYATKSATDKTVNFRLFVGVTEVSTGNVTLTIQFRIQAHPIRT